jgi:hypothetical protein
VAHHFEGEVGSPTCGPRAKRAPSAEARELRHIVCETAALSLFTYMLTPNHDRDHFDHFHMEIKGSVRWFLYH